MSTDAEKEENEARHVIGAKMMDTAVSVAVM